MSYLDPKITAMVNYQAFFFSTEIIYGKTYNSFFMGPLYWQMFTVIRTILSILSKEEAKPY